MKNATGFEENVEIVAALEKKKAKHRDLRILRPSAGLLDIEYKYLFLFQNERKTSSILQFKL